MPCSVLAVAAHVPLASGAGGAGHRVGPAHDTGDALSRPQAAVSRGAHNLAKRLVAQNQPLRARWRSAVFALDNLEVGAADAHGQRAHEYRARAWRRLRHFVEPC